MQLSCRPSAPGLENTVLLVERDGTALAGDLEDAFLAGCGPLERHPGGHSFGRRLGDLAADPAIETVIAVRNPRLVLDHLLLERLAAARRRAAPLRYAVAAAGGLTAEGGRASSLYSGTEPRLPVDTLPAPVTDPMPDLWLADASFVRALVAEGGPLPDTGLETVLALRGWLDGRLSLALPELGAGIDGPLLSRDPVRLDRALDRWITPVVADLGVETLLGRVQLRETPSEGMPGADLAEAIERGVAAACAPLSLSIVTRTRFDRPHLLDRLLASISRARLDGMDLEVVLSTDVAPSLARAELALLRDRFVNLTLRLCHNGPPGDRADAPPGAADPQPPGRPSRVANLIGGLRAAAKDHVAVIDDDDYVDLFAFRTLSRARFLGACPLIATTTEVHDEEWEATPRGRHVLRRSTRRLSWAADGWRRLFTGVNALPVCGLAMPRGRLLARLDAFEFRHDLSEDYALFLLVLTDPALPPVVELPGTFAHVSVRTGGENTVTMPDRRPWVRDIALYLADLNSSPAVAGPGLWRLLAGVAGAEPVPDGPARPEAAAGLRREIARRDREIAFLRRELAELRSAVLSEAALPAPPAAAPPGPARPSMRKAS